MTDFVNYTNEELLNISSEISTKLVENGFEYGWHKKITYTGVIYILVNPAFSNLVKIGYADDVEKRMKTFNKNSGLPDPYHCYAVYKVKKRLEDLKLHKLIDSLDSTLRHSSNREFYEISKEKAYEILSAIAQINGDEECLILNPFKDIFFENDVEKVEKVDKSKTDKKNNLTFELLGIPIGSELIFVGNKSKPFNLVVKTADNMNKITYQDKKYTLSGFATEKLGGSQQGGKYFTYNDELLTDIRKRLNK